MIKKLHYLKNYLEKSGYGKEAKSIQQLIKSAAPIIDIVSLPTEEEIEYDEEGEIKSIRPGGPIAKDTIQKGRYKSEEWYGALEALGPNVILIPFNEKELDYSPSALWGLGYIFGASSVKDYADLKQKANSFSIESPNKLGDLENLKEAFPGLWQAISSKLAELKLPEHEVVYVIYNEDDRRPRGSSFTFEKSPKYLSHDIGHIEGDFGEDYTFKGIILNFIEGALDCYVAEVESDDSEEPKEEGKITLKEVLSEESHDAFIEDDTKEMFIRDFFDGLFSAPTDQLYDIFSNALAGDPQYDRPRYVWHNNQDFELDPNKAGNLASLEDKMLKEIMDYVKSEKKGPLSYNKGSVILYDI